MPKFQKNMKTLNDELQRVLDSVKGISSNNLEESREQMDIESPQKTDDLLYFSNLVIEESLIKAIKGDYFDACPLERILYAINARLGRPLIKKKSAQGSIETILSALHCVDFDQMSIEIRAGLPTALLSYFSLNDKIGTDMLGADAWGRVKTEYEAFANPDSDTIETIKSKSGQSGKKKYSFLRNLAERLFNA